MVSRTPVIPELALHLLAVEQKATEVMASTNRRGLRWWEILAPALAGAMVGFFTYMAGQGAHMALASGIAITAFNVALVCAIEVRRLSKRLDAMIQLQASARTSPKLGS